MYYIVSGVVYLLLLLTLFLALRKPGNVDGAKAKKRFMTEMHKGLSKSDVKSRKWRVKSLPLYQRFLYWLWFDVSIFLFLGFPVMLWVSRGFVIRALYVSEPVIYFSDDNLSNFVLYFGGMMLGTAMSVGFSYLTYTNTIRKADQLYQMGSFQTYPVKFNILLSFICVLIAFPAVTMGYMSYQYCTEDEIVVKSAFSVAESRYTYSDITYVEQKTYKDGDISYTAYTDNGKRFEIYSGSESPEMLWVLENNSIAIGGSL